MTMAVLFCGVAQSTPPGKQAKAKREASSQKLAIYQFCDVDSYWFKIDFLSVPRGASLKEKVQRLCNRFSRLRIDVQNVETSGSKKIARLELIDQDKPEFIDKYPKKGEWHSAMQGTAGGGKLEETFRWNLAQPGYAGEWPDEFYVNYLGHNASEGANHCPGLGLTSRYHPARDATQQTSGTIEFVMPLFVRLEIESFLQASPPHYSITGVVDQNKLQRVKIDPQKILVQKLEFFSVSGERKKPVQTFYSINYFGYSRAYDPEQAYVPKDNEYLFSPPYSLDMAAAPVAPGVNRFSARLTVFETDRRFPLDWERREANNKILLTVDVPPTEAKPND